MRADAPPAGSQDHEGSGLAVDRVTVQFDQATAVDDVSLSVGAGEVVALLGPSGCGKSTLLRAVAGLHPVDSGSIRWDGRDLAGVPVHRRGFGLVFQDGQLFAHRDVAGNVAFGLQMIGTPKPDVRSRTAELLDLVGLAGYGRRSVGTLSGGEQQRVALARALAPRPRLLLLDEPLTGLDRGLRERLADDLAFILRHAGTTALHVTHDQDEAFAVADRVAVMAEGHLLQVDTPARLWAHPASRLVAEFLGYDILPAGTWSGLTGASLGVDGRPDVVLATAPGALRVLGPVTAHAWGAGRSAGPAPSAGDADPAHVGLVGRVVGRRTRRGGASTVQVELAGRAGTSRGPTVSATEGAGDSWQPGDLVQLGVDPAAAVAIPAD